MKVYIDKDFRCHLSDDGTMTEADVDFFDGKCDTFVEGYCYDTSDGFTSIYPWKDYKELESVQKQYEKDLADRADLEKAYNYLLTGGIA